MTCFRGDALRAAIGVSDGQHQHRPRLEHYFQHHADTQGVMSKGVALINNAVERFKSRSLSGWNHPPRGGDCSLVTHAELK